MKRFCSIWMAASKAVTRWLVLVLMGLAAVSTLLFYRLLQQIKNGSGPGFSELLKDSFVPLVFGVAFILFCLILLKQGFPKNTKTSYTLYRLPIGEPWVTLCWMLHHAIWFFILWAVETAIVLNLWRMYQNALTAEARHGLLLVLDCYRTPFLHSLLPLADTSRWIRNISAVIALGFTCAVCGFHNRKGKRDFGFQILAGTIIPVFSMEMAHFGADLFFTLTFIGFILYSILSVFAKEVSDCD